MAKKHLKSIRRHVQLKPKQMQCLQNFGSEKLDENHTDDGGSTTLEDKATHQEEVLSENEPRTTCVTIEHDKQSEESDPSLPVESVSNNT